MFRRSASLAIPHHKSFAAIPSLSLGSLGTRIAALNCHTHRSVKLPLFRHFQDQFLTTNKEKWGKKTGLCFARFVFLTFRGPLASHDSNPYPKRSRIARYNATKIINFNWATRQPWKKSSGIRLRPISRTDPPSRECRIGAQWTRWG